MGGLVGWRGAFFCVVPLAVVTLIWQCLTLSAVASREPIQTPMVMLALLRNRHFAIGMLAVLLSFMGQFTLFTYLRPFLEQVTGVNLSMLSAMLLIVGLTGLYRHIPCR